jgi:methanogenic corrinoid protein MtbC1
LQTDQLVRLVDEHHVKILLLSVLMLPSALRIRELKAALGNRDVRIVVGGAPFRLDEQLWKEVGADAMGRDSSDAISIVTEMMGGEL